MAITDAAHGPDHEDVARWRSNLGLVLQDLGDLEGARVQVARALAVSEAGLGPDVRLTATPLGGQPLGDAG
jgi:Tetratricopeptide repeat